jgi:hypothetical protein
MARQGRKAFLKRRVASRVSRVSSKEAYIVSFWSAEVRFRARSVLKTDIAFSASVLMQRAPKFTRLPER